MTDGGKTLRDYVLFAQCRMCNHRQRLDIETLSAIVGWDTPLEEIQPRLRCTNCGRSGDCSFGDGHDFILRHR